MNQITLRHRLLLLTLLPSMLIAIALVSYFTLSGIRALEGELRAKGMATVRYLAPISEYGIIAGQIESLHGLAQAAVQESGIKATIITNQKGRAIAVSGDLTSKACLKVLDDVDLEGANAGRRNRSMGCFRRASSPFAQRNGCTV